jgi:hypothetical protein
MAMAKKAMNDATSEAAAAGDVIAIPPAFNPIEAEPVAKAAECVFRGVPGYTIYLHAGLGYPGEAFIKFNPSGEYRPADEQERQALESYREKFGGVGVEWR